VKRIKVEIAPGVETEFVDRDRALAQVAEWAERSTGFPVVIFGPEGCGKTAFLRQAAETLRELGYDVFYLHLLARVFLAEVDDATSRRSSPTLSGGRWRTRNGAGSRWRCLTSRGRF
jgi:ABC-type phosphate/phosphonate transport system ATPase subunit